jgi:hypothetical protein
MTQINYAKKFKIDAVDRYMKTFSNIVRHKMFDAKKHGHVVVTAGEHFAERLVDRNLNHEFATKILSYAFETYPEKFLATVDTFIHYKDVILLVNSVQLDGYYKVRLNTMIKKDEETWINSKKQVPVQNITIELKEIINYVPKSIGN